LKTFGRTKCGLKFVAVPTAQRAGAVQVQGEDRTS
jgi:hypothetical protein